VEVIVVLKDDSEPCPHNITETKSRKVRNFENPKVDGELLSKPVVE